MGNQVTPQGTKGVVNQSLLKEHEKTVKEEA